MIQERLPHSYGHEVSARIIAKPLDSELARIQGFKSVRDFKAAQGGN